MRRYGYPREKHCRWCGKPYIATKPHNRDGFHNKACKQAHHRAYKKYVTANPRGADIGSPSKVTRKKQKKTGK